MRVVHVTNAYAPRSGGIRTTAHALGRGYRARGHDFVLVVPGRRAADEEHEWGRLVELPGPVVPGTGGYRVLLDVPRVQATLDGLAPDRLEVSDRLSLRRLGGWARRAGVPSLVIAHERVDGVLRAHLRLGERAARAVADRHNAGTARVFDRIVATTRYAATEFDRIGVPTTHVPLGVDLEAFHPLPPAGSGPSSPSEPSTPSEPSCLSGPATLVLCSRLSREKRPDLAVDALRVLVGRGLEARLVVLGDGPVLPSLRRRAQGLPVDFLGHVRQRERVARLLAEADVALAPGPVETFGLAALEALASGTPVVASSTSAVAELVTDDAGRCAPPEPQALADAVLDVLSWPVHVRRAAARRRAERFPWATTTQAMLAVHAAPAPSGVTR